MRTSSTFSILFWIHAHRVDKNNLSMIYSRITVNGKKVILSLKQKVNIDTWDAKRQKAKGFGKNSKSINYYLDEVKSELVQSYRDLKTESKIVTAHLVKARFLGEDKKIYSLNVMAFLC